jgi:phosphatidylglycerophosphatase A
VTQRGAGTEAAVLVATLFGVGRVRVVPGTFGTLAAIPAAIVMGYLLPPWAFAAATAVLAGLAIWTSGRAARALGLKDPRPVVIDEAAGLFVTLLFFPPAPATYVGAFVLFRLMDILKPFPARRAEDLPGGWGIVVDDLIAGVYANCGLRIFVWMLAVWSGSGA